VRKVHLDGTERARALSRAKARDRAAL